MNRARSGIAVLAFVLALAAAGLHVGLGPQTRRINIQWSEPTSEADRTHAERQLQLSAGMWTEGRTWTYALVDRSRQNIARIVSHPLVEDTHYIDRDRLVARDRSRTPQWVLQLGDLPGISRVTERLLPLAAALVLVGLVAMWRELKRGLVVSLRPEENAHTDAAGALTGPSTPGLARRSFSGGGTPRALIVIVLASLLLRVVLVLSGGQFYWPDERRYRDSQAIVEALSDGQVAEALGRLNSADHPLFKVVALLPAAVEQFVGDDPRIPALFLAAFSALNIWLLGRIAQRLGAGIHESVMAAGLLALASSFFYYARHLLPYDVAMTFGLLAIYVGVNRIARPTSSLLCGCVAGCAFLTYTGSWMFALTALLIHVVESADRHQAIGRGILAAIGWLAPIGVVLGLNWVVGGHLVEGVLQFSGRVNEGTFEEGWRLPWAYLWHAEHLLLLVWLACTAWWVYRWPVALKRPTVRIALVGLVALYAALVVSSVLLEIFVVYGRLARQLVPFFCLASAAALNDMRLSSSRVMPMLMRAIVVVVALQGIANLLVPLRQWFPSEFLQSGGEPTVPGMVAVHASHIYPAPQPVTLPKRYRVVREASHPLQFIPYQYEGYTPAQRNALRSTDIRMRLIVPLD